MPTRRTRLGTWGEEQANRFLQDCGYEILTTNYRCSHGEVDIVAQEGEELVFVEVRTRHTDSFVAPEESLSGAKVSRLVATCQDYLENKAQTDAAWRIDLVCVYIERVREGSEGHGLGQERRVPRIQHLPHAVQL